MFDELITPPFNHGIFPDMTWDEYREARGLNPSWLTAAFKSLKHFRHKKQDDSCYSQGKSIGSAAHALILEPEQFGGRFAVWDGDFRSKASREFREQADAAGQEVIKLSDYEEAHRIAESVHEHPTARTLFGSVMQTEVSLFCEMWGVQCKGRVDMIGGGVLVDPKTTTNVEKRAFGRIFAQLHYAAKLACYKRWAEALGQVVNEVFVIAVENQPPYDVAVIPVPEVVLDNAWGRVERTVEQIKRAIETDHWPGVADGYYELEIPNWSMDEEELLEWNG